MSSEFSDAGVDNLALRLALDVVLGKKFVKGWVAKNLTRSFGRGIFSAILLITSSGRSKREVRSVKKLLGRFASGS